MRNLIELEKIIKKQILAFAIIISFLGCVDEHKIEGLICPCPSGYVCCPFSNTCSSNYETCPQAEQVLDDMQMPASNKAGGQWVIDSDYWPRLGTGAYPDAQTAHESSTKIWTLDHTIDMSPSTSGTMRVQDGYEDVDAGSGQALVGIIEILTPIPTDDQSLLAYAGFLMEFLPRDTTNCTTDCWTPEASGVARDLSSHKSITLGIRCDMGRQLTFAIHTLTNYAAGYGNLITCTGSLQNITLDFANLLPLSGSTSPFDLEDSFRISLSRNNDGTSETTKLEIYGVALDYNIFEELTPSQ